MDGYNKDGYKDKRVYNHDESINGIIFILRIWVGESM